MKIIRSVDSENIFFEFNYCIFDPIMFEGVIDILKDLKIQFISFGFNYFKNLSSCPVLINLNKLNLYQKKSIKKLMVDSIETYGRSNLDKNSIINVFLNSQFEEHEIVNFLSELMVVDNKLFRFYDSRVLVFIYIYLSGNKRSINIFKKISKNGWYFTINNEFYNILTTDCLFSADFSGLDYVRNEIKDLNSSKKNIEIFNKIYSELEF